MVDFLKDRNQRAVLNGQNSSWVNAETGVPQGTILGKLLFLISENLVSNPKLFADGTSLCSVIFDKGFSTKNLSDDLNTINNWASQQKMSFNLNLIK